MFGQSGTGGVSGVDNDNGAELSTLTLGLGNLLANGRDISGPREGFIKVVRNWGSINESEGSGIERVLRDRNKDTSFFRGADDMEEGGDTG